MGGLLTLPSFVDTFPQIDTINTTGALQSYNSTLQGEFCDRFVSESMVSHDEFCYAGVSISI